MTNEIILILYIIIGSLACIFIFLDQRKQINALKEEKHFWYKKYMSQSSRQDFIKFIEKINKKG